jgi:hypothetical protein
MGGGTDSCSDDGVISSLFASDVRVLGVSLFVSAIPAPSLSEQCKAIASVSDGSGGPVSLVTSHDSSVSGATSRSLGQLTVYFPTPVLLKDNGIDKLLVSVERDSGTGGCMVEANWVVQISGP